MFVSAQDPDLRSGNDGVPDRYGAGTSPRRSRTKAPARVAPVCGSKITEFAPLPSTNKFPSTVSSIWLAERPLALTSPAAANWTTVPPWIFRQSGAGRNRDVAADHVGICASGSSRSG